MTFPDAKDEGMLLVLTMLDAALARDAKTFEDTKKLLSPDTLTVLFARLSYALAIDLGGLHAPDEADTAVAARSALQKFRFDYLARLASLSDDTENN
jgi:hypothetical protein